MLICIHGNISSGKSTFIDNYDLNIIKFKENLDYL